MTEIEKLREQLKRLSLHTMANIFEAETEKAAKSKISHTVFLSRLVAAEVANKTDRSVNARIAKARFPAIKTLESFDFSFQPSLPSAMIKELAELGFMAHASNILNLNYQ